MKRASTRSNQKDGGRITAVLLAWYDQNARDLPWRAKGRKHTPPYHVWLSEIMLQQTVVKAVIPYFETFVARFPTIEDLARAERDEVLRLWAGLGYYSRARNLHACAQRVVEDHNGQFPKTVDALRKLPGIGSYTAGAIAAIAFGKPEAAIDGNVDRVMSRLYMIDVPVAEAKALIREKTEALVPEDRPGDFAQALMDLGATICIPKAPRCGQCPLSKQCKAHKADEATLYPVRPIKKAKPKRFGAAFVVRRKDGAVLLVDRPDKGLLGGMTGVPTSEWINTQIDETLLIKSAPVKARWTKHDQEVVHVFTHFTLTLAVYSTEVARSLSLKAPYRWSSANGPEGEALPTLFRKVIAAVR